MTVEQEIKKLYDDIITLTLERMNTKPQPEWERLHNQILEKEKQIKILKAGGSIQQPPKFRELDSKLTPAPQAKLTAEFSL